MYGAVRLLSPALGGPSGVAVAIEVLIGGGVPVGLSLVWCRVPGRMSLVRRLLRLGRNHMPGLSENPG